MQSRLTAGWRQNVAGMPLPSKPIYVMNHHLFRPMQDYSLNQFLAAAGTPPLDIEVCDVTLRDGEQMPGVVFRADEKLDIALRLDEIGVEVIEAGFPVVSPAEMNAVRECSTWDWMPSIRPLQVRQEGCGCGHRLRRGYGQRIHRHL